MKAIALQLEKQVSSTLIDLLDDMFASCDDLYFDLASRASSNLEQNLYFESMREVRVKAPSSRKNFQQLLANALNALHGNKASAAKKQNAKDDSELALVADDQVEQSVAIQSMTTHARAISKRPLFELRHRLQALYKLKSLDEDDNALDPAAIIALFTEATAHIGIDIKARIILLKQYERIVVNRLPEIYTRINKLLEENGVKFVPPKKTAAPRSRSTTSASDSTNLLDEFGSLLGDDSQTHYQYANPSFNELSNLLGRLRASNTSSAQNFPLFTSSGNTVLSNEQLLTLLDTAQSRSLTQNRSNIDLREILQTLISQAQEGEESVAVEKVDEDIINLVAMFFDFVLDDHSIPDNVKALIGRLQMPALKIALKDKNFFTDNDHAVRRFINEIARISVGVNDDDKAAKSLYQKLEQWVHDIQSTTGSAVDAFASSLEELLAYMKDLEKRAELVEKRTNETAQGQAKQQLAKIKAQQAIKESMDGKKIATPVSEFIVDLWQQALYIAILKYGEESSEWLSSLQTMQDLIWCARKHVDEKSQQRFIRIRAELEARLNAGLKRTSISDAQRQNGVDGICKTIDELSSIESDKKAIPEDTFDATKDQRLDAANAEKSWTEMTALERQQKKIEELTFEYIEKAESYPIGSWFEFKGATGGAIIRAKLASRLEASDNYIFVNRFGFKTLEKNRKQFAYDLQRNRARELRTGPIFERSLHQMVSRLKQI